MAQIITFGCRINAFESQILKETLKNYDNLFVINSCAVTLEAERQCKQEIRKIRKAHPAAKIVLTGCAAQVSAAKFAAMPELDLILGNAEKRNILQHLDSLQKQNVSDIFAHTDYDRHAITGFEGRQKAFVAVQTGCNHRCTYCIVPYARGKSCSVPQAQILEQIKALLDKEFKEICLTGIDLCSYKPSLAELTTEILQTFPSLQTLSFGSLDPAAMNEQFLQLITSEPRILPYFHFSCQSGDNAVLKAMGRRHTGEQMIKICKFIKEKLPHAVIGADFICGFPSETEENFANTLKLVKEANITHLHVFPYSERPGTPAAQMEQIPMQIRRKRAAILRNLGEQSNG